MSVPENSTGWPGSRTGKPYKGEVLVSFTWRLLGTSPVGPPVLCWESLVCLGSRWALLQLQKVAFVTSNLPWVFQGTTRTSLVLISGVIASGPIYSIH